MSYHRSQNKYNTHSCIVVCYFPQRVNSFCSSYCSIDLFVCRFIRLCVCFSYVNVHIHCYVYIMKMCQKYTASAILCKAKGVIIIVETNLLL